MVDDDSDSVAAYFELLGPPPVGSLIQSMEGWLYHHYGSYEDSTAYKLCPLYKDDLEFVCLEISSHALDQNRLARIFLDTVCILNIGGISNVTVLDEHKNDNFLSRDIGPGNCLIDEWVRKKSKKRYDIDGSLAGIGKTDELILNQALENFNNNFSDGNYAGVGTIGNADTSNPGALIGCAVGHTASNLSAIESSNTSSAANADDDQICTNYHGDLA